MKLPPKPKFTKQEIIAAALELVREKGVDALTARELASKLGSSARPIFTLFSGMDELKKEVVTASLDLYEKYRDKTQGYKPEFKRLGMQMVMFALYEPRLYQLLFMQPDSNAVNFGDIFNRMGDYGARGLDALHESYGFTREQGMSVFRDIWIYTYGVAALCATGACKFTESKISEMLSNEFFALLNNTTGGQDKYGK